jgi:hypothetical protein
MEIRTKDGQPFDIPVEGSLGLLALGDIGLVLWRQKIQEAKKAMAARSKTEDRAPTRGVDGDRSEDDHE